MALFQDIDELDSAVNEASSPVIGVATQGPYLLAESEQMALLLEGQQEALELVSRGATLDEILTYLSLLVERALAPVACRILLVHSNGNGPCHNAAPNLPAELGGMTGNGAARSWSGPVEDAASNGIRIDVQDFVTDARWPDHAAQALACNFRACWCEPLAD